MIANNLANIDTPSFKKDVATFHEYLAHAEKVQDPHDIPAGRIQDKDFYPLDARDQSYVIMDGTHSMFKQGGLRVTQAPLDVAIDGPGFFEVLTPSGIRYARGGSMKIGVDGSLVTEQGYPLLSADGEASQPQARKISMRDTQGPISISNAGDIFAGGTILASLRVVEFPSTQGLKKQGSLLFENTNPQLVPHDALQTVVRQGVLETSNVQPISEMAEMIQANRLFEQDLKALKTVGEMLGREVSDIGKI